jgi:hypothetical protein
MTIESQNNPLEGIKSPFTELVQETNLKIKRVIESSPPYDTIHLIEAPPGKEN